MAEIRTEPYIVWVDVGEDTYECEAFGPDHTLGDIARWICRNRSEAEELLYILKKELE